MSSDAKVAYKICKSVMAGDLSEDLRYIQIGLINHSRWLTTETRILYLWTRKHGLTGKSLQTLAMLAKFALQSYFKLYFDIKVRNKTKDGPNHILTQLRILRCQPNEVRDIVTYYVQTGAWNSHSESFLTALIFSPLKEDRIFAIDQIRKMRGDKALGKMGVRKHLTPKLNLSARNLISLISWENDVNEPVLLVQFLQKS